METPYFKHLRQEVMRLGGLFNAHLHLCRAGTLDETERLLAAGAETDDDGISHLSLSRKHAIIPLIHNSSDYDRENIRKRLNLFLDLMEQAGTTRADTLVDVTTGRLGLSVMEEFLAVKEERRGALDLQVGAYTPLGFRDDEPGRWQFVEQAAEMADLVGSLPERDDHDIYPDHIGYIENCRRTLKMAESLNKPIHIHVDQKNDPSECGTEIILSVIDELGLSYPDPEPMVWLVHVISPSAYDEAKFNDLAAEIAEKNVGIICCPSAAVSMRQLRPIRTPTHNSIARVMDFLAAGVHVRLGSDNINDITSPAGTADLVDEIFVLSNAVRFYDVGILAKLAAGCLLDDADRQKIRHHLVLDQAETEQAVVGARKSVADFEPEQSRLI